MVDNDIYDNRGKYARFKDSIREFLAEPSGMRIYRIKNPRNLEHFKRLFFKLDSRGGAYVRRMRLCRTFQMVCHYIEQDLADVDRDDIDYLMLQSQTHNKTPSTKKGFVSDLKFLWKILFPDKDEKGRSDETIVPYVVRHLSTKIDKSLEKVRKDRLTVEEFDKILSAFSHDRRMQALISLSFESLGRPQEILGRRLKDVELFDDYAKITITEHGKEGIGILRCIDSFFYLSKWLNEHPLKDHPEAHLFINLGTRNRYKQFTTFAANKLLRECCRKLGINKPITLYSLKRNGVTFCRLRGDSDVDIQHRARWSSTKQLKTYDLSHQDDSFKIELIRRGIIQPDEKNKDLAPRTKECIFCHATNGVAEMICHQCHRPLDRKALEPQNEEPHKETESLKEQLLLLRQEMKILMAREQRRSSYDEMFDRLARNPAFQELWMQERVRATEAENQKEERALPLSP
jgi:integrase/recombinase XerD